MDDAQGAEPLLSAELVADLAHEIRDELNSIHIHFGLLERELSAWGPNRPPPVTVELAGITRSLGAIEALLGDFQRLARPLELCYEDGDVRALVRELVAFLAPEAQARGIALTANVTAAPARASFDSAQIKRALLDIVLIGLDAMPPGSGIELVCGTRPPTWTLAVRGATALAPDGRERLGSPFVGAAAGARLGLAIARQIITAHGGTLAVHDAGGRGTELRLTLPCAPPRHG